MVTTSWAVTTAPSSSTICAIRPGRPRTRSRDQRQTELRTGVQPEGPSLRSDGRDSPFAPGLRPGDPARPQLGQGVHQSRQYPPELRRYDHALADYSAAVELDPKGAYSLYSRGLTMRALGYEEQAKLDI